MSADDRTGMAEDRTDLAEDRTLLANERTFAGWLRTAFASIALGLAFHAIFPKIEPTWLAKGIASLFIVLGVWVAWQAERRATKLAKERQAHAVELVGSTNFLTMAIATTAGAISLLAALWFFV